MSHPGLHHTHAFEYVDDFADAADFSTFPTTEWENAKRKFGELMADYEKLRNRRSGIHGSNLDLYLIILLWENR